METMAVYHQVDEDVDCATFDCWKTANFWVTNGQKAWAVCEDCRDELTSEPHNYKELRVL